MDDRARVVAFSRWVEDTVAERREPWRFGTHLSDDTFPTKYDANFLRVERPVGPTTAAEIHAIAEERQAGLRHREVVVPDDDDGARLAPGFVELGYEADRLVSMVLRREPDRPPPDVRATEVDLPTVHPMMVAAGLEDVPGLSRADALMLADYRTVVRDRIGARFFAGWVDETIAGCCELYVHDGVAQIENVDTLGAYRNRGVARAYLTAAIEAGWEAGADLLFVVADDADWPKHLYAKLGFDEVEHHRQFTKAPRGTAS
ncbi:MAG TPA: GNAT family N-acetyltransferase [Actinomycetota bacterium]|nr:GNAT family N-acetyltransferase [Actinomycetota bacterium]